MQFNFHKAYQLTLLFFTIIGMHVVTFMPRGSGLYVSSNMIGWGVVSLLISYGFWYVYKNKAITYSKLSLYVVSGVLLLILPVTYSNSSLDNFLPRLIALIAGVLFLFSLYQCKFGLTDRVKILNIFLIGILIEGILGFLQFFVFNFLEWDFGYYDLLNLRPSGVFRQPNIMASFMASGIVISLFLLYKEINNLNKKILYIYYSVLFICSTILLILQSKTGYLGLLLSLLLLIPVIFKHFNRVKVGIIFILLGLIWGIISLNIIKGVERGEKLYTDGGIRLDIINVGFDIFEKSPLLGHGYGNFERVYRSAHIKKMKTEESLGEPLENLHHPHNEILFWGIEGGIVALFGLLILIIGFIQIFPRNMLRENSALLSLLVPILLHTQFEYPFYTSLIHLLLFITLIWYIDESLNNSREKNIGKNEATKYIGILIPILVIPFMVSGLHTMKSMSDFHESKYKDVQYLLNVKNDLIWHDYISRIYQNIYFNKGMKTGDVDSLTSYIVWGLNYVETKPRVKIYDNMIKSIQLIESKGNEYNYETKVKIFTDAKLMYPKVFTYKIVKG
ncbi:Wzy polymerase domain-containing protein [Thalassotalea psychrophila]|uniref:Wzy polymerase domain-containing protein n=1 Tax=Thalassotalea psychrophila TaxID=3065647 RepID=A0ABY9TW19_9GAMM|nr:Wzy polymerase domain-containing protein [Colwelliaceae bacterium SQ149]